MHLKKKNRWVGGENEMEPQITIINEIEIQLKCP
jgi:hypothetical protein